MKNNHITFLKTYF
jgi:hypothetical protein